MPRVLCLLLVVAALAACTSPRPSQREAPMLRAIGEPYATPSGEVFLIRVQDEFRLIRCIPEGPIAGCYEDVLALPSGGVAWNEWISVDTVPGLRVAFLSPTEVALRMEAAPVMAR